MAGSGKDPVAAFAEQKLNVRLSPSQVDIAAAIAICRRIAVRSCHSSGKTFLAAVLAIYWLLRYPDSKVIITGPSFTQIRTVLFGQIHSLLRGMRTMRMRQLGADANLTEVRLTPSNFILGVSTDAPERISGHHGGHILVIIDEASGVDAKIWESVESLLASGDAKLLAIGNPLVAAGPFYEAFTRNAQGWQTFSIGWRDTPNFEGIQTIDELLALEPSEVERDPWPMLLTRRWVISAYHQWWNGSPASSPLWMARVEGQFPLSSTNSLFNLEWLESARRPFTDQGTDIIIGCDPAGPGKDKTAVVATCGGAILDSAAFSDPDGAIGPVIQFCRRYAQRVRLVRVDTAGLGFHFPGYLIQAGFRCEGINVAKACDKDEDKQRFANVKASRYWHLRERFQRGDISGLTAEMVSELSVMTYLIDTSGRTAIAGKDDVKSVLGHSPDLGEALMLALGQGPPVPLDYRFIQRGQAHVPGAATGLRALGYRESAEEAQRNYESDLIGERRRGTWDSFAPPRGSWNRQRGY
jgi:hypothetical protein